MRNLEDRVSIFGLQDKFDEFAVLLAELLGLPDVFYMPLNKTPSNAAKVSRKQTEELRELLADDIAFYDGAVQLYRRRAEALTFDLAARVRAFEQEKKVSRAAQSSPSLERFIFVSDFHYFCRVKRARAAQLISLAGG